jgi:hypothetical protein
MVGVFGRWVGKMVFFEMVFVHPCRVLVWLGPTDDVEISPIGNMVTVA